MTRIALATCSDLPDLDVDDVPLLDALRARGATAQPAVWDDESVDWASFDLVVVRSTWDYAKQPEAFLAWAARVESVTTLANPLSVIRWNADKHYLRELEAAGVAVVPTIWLEPDPRLNGRALHTRFPALGEIVIKPAVSAGSVDTGRYTAIDAGSRGLAIQHARRLLGDDRSVMVQRYVTSVDTHGERAHVFIGGEYSHSVLKEAMLDGPDAGQELYKKEQMNPITASAAEVEMAREVIATACRTFTPDGGCDPAQFLYARVDVVSDDHGAPLLMELELVEPSLFTSLAEGARDRFADAIMARAS